MASYVNFNKASSIKLPIGGEPSFLSKITSSVRNTSTTTLLIVAAVILFGIIAVYYYYYYVAPKFNPKYSHNTEEGNTNGNGSGSSGGGQDAELLFFFADWCPHCKAAKPIWNDLKSEYENKTINGYHVVFTEIDCSTETAEVDQMMNKYNVEGYPTIKLLKDGQVIEYDAKPSKETLTKFLNTVL
jgi:thiol-disulfide isomerase/thioredoxin